MPFDRVSNVGHWQGMPSTIIYADQHGNEVRDGLDDVVDNDSIASSQSYNPDDEFVHSNNSSDDDDDYPSSGEDDNQEHNSDSSSSESSNEDDNPDIDQHHPVEAAPIIQKGLHDRHPQQQDHGHQPPDLQLDNKLGLDPDPPLVDNSSIDTPSHATQDSGVQGHESNMQLELRSDAEDSNPPVPEQD